MTLSELERSLAGVLKSGQLGIPVALRIHASLPGCGNDLTDALGLFGPLIRLVSEEASGQLQAMQHSSGRQLSVLWTAANGRTVFLSLVSVPQAKQSLQALVVGNHGIAKLTGEAAWNEPDSPSKSALWQAEIHESLNRGTSIAVESS